jgi:predicted permease
MGDIFQDLGFGARLLHKRLGFTALAVLTLALGIGTNTAIFSAVRAILIEPLPLHDPASLVLFSDTTSEGTSTGRPPAEVWQQTSFPAYRHFAEHVPAFRALAAFRSGEDRLSVVPEGRGEATLASGHLVSGNFFAVLDQKAFLGRTLQPEDDRPEASPAAVVSYGYWQQHLAASPSAVGLKMTVNGVPLTIVGVMPERFFGLRVRRAPDLWLPLDLQARIERRDDYLRTRDAYWLNLVGRLAPGRTLGAAQAEFDVALKQYLRSQAGDPPPETWKQALERASVRLAPGGRGISGLRTSYAEALRLLMMAAGFVLLISCANLTNLLLSRAAERRSEIAMRLALGAGRGRLVRQLLTESLLLAALGGTAGLLLALWGVDALKKLVSKTAPVDVGLSLPVLLFTGAVSIAAGLLVGLAPALRAGRHDLLGWMRSRSEGAAGGGRLRGGLAPMLIVGQVALSLVLLVGSGLLVRSLRNLSHADVGFARDRVVLLDIDPRVGGLETGELPSYYRSLLERTRAVPGVTAATVASYSPMNGTNRTSNVTVEGFADPGSETVVDVNQVGPRFAQVFGVPLVRGREFDDRDGPGGPRVALVSEAFVRAYLPDVDPIGRHVGLGDKRENADISIVGVLGDVHYESPRDPAPRMLYLPILQSRDQSAYLGELEVRTAGGPDGVVPALRRAVAEVDGRVPLAGVTTLEAQVDDSVAIERLLAQLIGAFGGLALVLACVGLYGVVSQAVARRAHEVGIRMALGADRRRILSMVLKEAGKLILAGLLLGLPGALGAARLLGHRLFGVGPADPVTLAASGLLLLAVALLAGYIPARRASRVEPLAALRSD